MTGPVVTGSDVTGSDVTGSGGNGSDGNGSGVTGPGGNGAGGNGADRYGADRYGPVEAVAVAFAPVPPQTGNARIDEALGALAAAGDAPSDQLVAPLTEADRALRETLDSIGDD